MTLFKGRQCRRWSLKTDNLKQKSNMVIWRTFPLQTRPVISILKAGEDIITMEKVNQ
jgi:hypothetical protein